MPTMTQVDKKSRLWLAWSHYLVSDEYANTRKWALHEQHVDGSLWGAFMTGFLAAGGRL